MSRDKIWRSLVTLCDLCRRYHNNELTHTEFRAMVMSTMAEIETIVKG